MILEVRFADDLLSTLARLKQIHGKSAIWRNKWNRKKYFVGCYASWLKDRIFAVTNTGVKILMYIQILILVKAAFLLVGIQRPRYFDETSEKSGNYCTHGLGTKKKKTIFVNICSDTTPLPLLFAFALWYPSSPLSPNEITECTQMQNQNNYLFFLQYFYII